MKKFLLAIIILSFFIVFSKPVLADVSVANGSAKLLANKESSDIDYRVVSLKRFFEKYDSPLADYAEKFVKEADKYNLDWRLVPAISGVESTFGKRIPYGSFNAYGFIR